MLPGIDGMLPGIEEELELEELELEELELEELELEELELELDELGLDELGLDGLDGLEGDELGVLGVLGVDGMELWLELQAARIAKDATRVALDRFRQQDMESPVVSSWLIGLVRIMSVRG